MVAAVLLGVWGIAARYDNRLRDRIDSQSKQLRDRIDSQSEQLRDRIDSQERRLPSSLDSSENEWPSSKGSWRGCGEAITGKRAA